MKKFLLLPVVALVLFTIQSCLKDKLTKTYTVLEAVYRDRAEVLADIKSGTPRSINNPGKIYQYGNYLFLNDINKGVHIIDNSDPSHPVIKAFINIPGNLDIAVKGNMLYADLYTDMVTVDITDPLNAKLGKIVTKIFPERQYGSHFRYDTSKIIVDWTRRTVTDRIEVENRCNSCFFLDAFAASSMAAPGVKSNAGGGSMARFSIINDYLYAVNNYSLNIVNISNPADPLKNGAIGVGQNIETIYPFKQKLFIGSSTGMFIFDITNPAVPVRQGQFTHARACDPVVADDNYAYVTLRAGSICQGTTNEMDVISVSNIMAPSLAKKYNMNSPYGLGKEDNYLFVCDDGLKVYNTSDVMNLQLIKHIRGLETYDVIAGNRKLILVAKDGLYQYDYSNINNIRELSKIEVNRK